MPSGVFDDSGWIVGGEFKLDFSGIGVAKAGTTWIAHCLAEHPAVCMAVGKETNYFLRNHIASQLAARAYYYTAHNDEGLEWYKGKFSHHEPGQLYGEFSNSYLADPEAASLLHAHNPELKLICSVRNPIDTAYAGYFELSLFQPLPDTFEKALDRYPQMLEYCLFFRNLQPFLERFPRDRVHLMLYEDIRADPAAAYRGICRFLAIDPSFVPPSMDKRVNPRMVVRSRTLLKLRCAIRDIMRSTATTRKLRQGLVRLGADRVALKLVGRMNERPVKAPPLAPETRRGLVEYFRKDVEALAGLLNRDLSHWSES